MEYYSAIKRNTFESVLMRWINLEPIIQSIIRKRKINVRKHLTGGFLCAVLDLSGILCSLLIPEYSGIKRGGKPLPGAEESRHFLH